MPFFKNIGHNHKKDGANSELVLHPADNQNISSNYSIWLTQISSKVIQKFANRHIISIMSDTANPIQSDIAETRESIKLHAPNDNDDPETKHLKEANMAFLTKKLTTLDEESTLSKVQQQQACSFILDRMSRESKALVDTETGLDSSKQQYQCLNKLLSSIRLTHSENVNILPELRASQAMTNLVQTKMKSGESISQYKERYEEAVSSAENYLGNMISLNGLVFKFDDNVTKKTILDSTKEGGTTTIKAEVLFEIPSCDLDTTCLKKNDISDIDVSDLLIENHIEHYTKQLFSFNEHLTTGLFGRSLNTDNNTIFNKIIEASIRGSDFPSNIHTLIKELELYRQVLDNNNPNKHIRNTNRFAPKDKSSDSSKAKDHSSSAWVGVNVAITGNYNKGKHGCSHCRSLGRFYWRNHSATDCRDNPKNKNKGATQEKVKTHAVLSENDKSSLAKQILALLRADNTDTSAAQPVPTTPGVIGNHLYIHRDVGNYAITEDTMDNVLRNSAENLPMKGTYKPIVWQTETDLNIDTATTTATASTTATATTNDKRSYLEVTKSSLASNVHLNPVTILANRKPPIDSNILLDSGATHSVFSDKNLLTNIRAIPPESIGSFNGNTITSTAIGYFDLCGIHLWAYIVKANTVNIISLGQVVKVLQGDSNEKGAATLHIDKEFNFVLSHMEKDTIFQYRKNNLWSISKELFKTAATVKPTYLLQQVDHYEEHKILATNNNNFNSLDSTTEDLLNKLSKHEAKRVVDTEILRRACSLPTYIDLKKMISNGTITDTHVLPQDVDTASATFGITSSERSGKGTFKPIKFMSRSEIEPSHAKLIIIEQDILEIDNTYYLVSIDRELGFIQAHHIARKSLLPLQSAIQKAINTYERVGMHVSTVYWDGESSARSLENAHEDLHKLQHLIVTLTPGDKTNVGRAERAIRTIKERIRAYRMFDLALFPDNRLSSRNALHLTIRNSLVTWVCQSLNYTICNRTSDNDNQSTPHELYYGWKISSKRELKFPFGCYVHSQDSPINSSTYNNTETPRGFEGIIIGRVHTKQGGWKILDLHTKKSKTRINVTQLPLTTSLIYRIKDLIGYSPAILKFLEEHTEQYDEDDALDDKYNELLEEINNSTDFNPSEFYTEEYDQDIIDTLAHDIDLEDFDNIINNISTNDFNPSTQPNTTKDFDNKMQNILMINSVLALQLSKDNEDSYDTIFDKLQEQDFNIKTLHKSHPDVISTGEESILKELTSLFVTHKALTLVKENEINVGKDEVITCRLFLKNKYTALAEYIKTKARLVAGGMLQQRGVQENLYSPTLDITSLHILIALFASECRHITTYDIATAYLNAVMNHLDHKIFIRIPKDVTNYLNIIIKVDEYTAKDGYVYARVDKALYGLIHSAKLWNEHIHTTLIDLGYKRNLYDTAVYTKFHNNYRNDIGLYIDDLLSGDTSPNRHLQTELESVLQKKYKNITTNYGDTHNFLGATITFDKKTKSATITMNKIIQNIISWSDNKVANSPANENLFTIDLQSPKLNESTSKLFHSRVALLLYVSRRLLPSIAVVIAFLSTRINEASNQDWDKLIRVANWLKRYPNQALVLKNEFTTINEAPHVLIQCYVDASFGVHANKRSHSGLVVIMGKFSTILNNSSKQKRAAKSTSESECIALAEKVSFGLFIRLFLINMGYKVQLEVMEDNQTAIMRNTQVSRPALATRHMSIEYFWLLDYVEEGIVTVKSVTDPEQLADINTKPLTGSKFYDKSIMVQNHDWRNNS